MTTRADRYTQLQKVPDLFADFLTDLTPHPITKDVSRLKNEQAIRQSVKNLVLTNYGERLFQPTIGSNVYRSLFDPNDQFLANSLETSVRQTITANEPRVNVLDVRVLSTRDDNYISINIVFFIINSMQPQSIDVILRRVR